MIDYSNCAALSEAMIDDILADSFPASDPPPWALGREPQSFERDVGDLSKKKRIQDSTLERKDAGLARDKAVIL